MSLPAGTGRWASHRTGAQHFHNVADVPTEGSSARPSEALLEIPNGLHSEWLPVTVVASDGQQLLHLGAKLLP